MSTAPSPHELKVVRKIKAPRQRVFEAFVKPDLLAAWFGPRGFSIPSVEADVREGGGYRIVMKARTGESYVVSGRYRAVQPPSRVVFTWKWQDGPMAALPETLVTVSLDEQGEDTDVTLVHSGFPTCDARDGHLDGWSSSVGKLVDLTDRRKSAASLTVYGDPRSSYVRSVLFALGEKGLSFQIEPTPPQTPEQKTRHPYGKIPAFSDGDFQLFETNAILRYIDEAFDGPSYAGANSRARAKVEQWVSVVHSYVYPAAISDFALQYILPRGPGGAPDAEAIARGVTRSKDVLGALEHAYGEREFLVGSSLTTVDLLLAPIVSTMLAMPRGQEIVEGMPKLVAAHRAIAARPAFVAAERAAAR